MNTSLFFQRRSGGFLGLGLVLLFIPTAPAAEGGDRYADEKFDFALTVPAPWKSAPLQDYTVPGTVRTAWAGDGGASVVAFVQEPGMPFSPRFLLDASADAVEQKLGAKVEAREVRTVAGKKAMWLGYSGKGTGGAVDGKGAVETTQHWVAIPRKADVVIVLLTTPTARYAALKPSFEAALGSLKVGGEQTTEQRDAK